VPVQVRPRAPFKSMTYAITKDNLNFIQP